jgi:toxoflavin synthase
MAVYDSISEQYKKNRDEMEQLPFHNYFETYTLFNILGDPVGKSILDLACGNGNYTRKFKRKGAATVVGVDISEKQLEQARLEEDRERLGIEYIRGDVRKLGDIDNFDLVVAVYLLPYSRTKEELLQMCQSIFANLKPGGRFVTIQDNPEMTPDMYRLFDKYKECYRSIDGPLEEGSPIKITFDAPEGQNFSVDIYYHRRATYEWALQTVGFKEIHWRRCIVSPEGLEQLGHEFWQNALDYQPIVGIECVK